MPNLPPSVMPLELVVTVVEVASTAPPPEIAEHVFSSRAPLKVGVPAQELVPKSWKASVVEVTVTSSAVAVEVVGVKNT